MSGKCFEACPWERWEIHKTVITLSQVLEAAADVQQNVLLNIEECNLDDLNTIATNALSLLQNAQRAITGECEVCYEKGADLQLYEGRIICVGCVMIKEIEK